MNLRPLVPQTADTQPGTLSSNDIHQPRDLQFVRKRVDSASKCDGLKNPYGPAMSPNVNGGYLEPRAHMSIEEACAILAGIHTEEDDLTGFVILPGAGPDGRISAARYSLAWSTIREHGKLQGGAR